MRNMKKRGISLLLTVLMVMASLVVAVPMTASAQAPTNMTELNATKMFDMQINCTEYGRLSHDTEDVRSITNSVTGKDAGTIPSVTGAIVKDTLLKKPVYYMPKTDHNSFLRVAGVDNTNGLTVEMFVKLEGSDTNLHTLVRSDEINFNLNRWENGNWAGLWLGGSSEDDVHIESGYTETFPTDMWLHVVRVEDTDGKQYLYINGQLAYSGDTGKNTIKTNFNLEFGSVSYYFQNTGAYPSEGYYFSNIRVYESVASAALVKSLCDKAIEDNTPDVLGDFTDLVPNAWYTEAIRVAVSEGLFGGVSPTVFAPDMNMSRAMFVRVVTNLVGADLDDYTNVPEVFSDVNKDQWFYKDVMWAVDNGIVNGMTPTTFDPDGNITREQMCVMIKRLLDAYNITLDSLRGPIGFADLNTVGSWAIDAVTMCYETGIINGINNNMVPTGLATRAQVAQIFTNLLDALNH